MIADPRPLALPYAIARPADIGSEVVPAALKLRIALLAPELVAAIPLNLA